MDSLKSGLATAGKFTYKGTKTVAKAGYNTSKKHMHKKDKDTHHTDHHEEDEYSEDYHTPRSVNTLRDPSSFPPPPTRSGQAGHVAGNTAGSIAGNYSGYSQPTAAANNTISYNAQAQNTPYSSPAQQQPVSPQPPVQNSQYNPTQNYAIQQPQQPAGTNANYSYGNQQHPAGQAPIVNSTTPNHQYNANNTFQSNLPNQQVNVAAPTQSTNNNFNQMAANNTYTNSGQVAYNSQQQQLQQNPQQNTYSNAPYQVQAQAAYNPVLQQQQQQQQQPEYNTQLQQNQQLDNQQVYGQQQQIYSNNTQPQYGSQTQQTSYTQSAPPQQTQSPEQPIYGRGIAPPVQASAYRPMPSIPPDVNQTAITSTNSANEALQNRIPMNNVDLSSLPPPPTHRDRGRASVENETIDENMQTNNSTIDSSSVASADIHNNSIRNIPAPAVGRPGAATRAVPPPPPRRTTSQSMSTNSVVETSPGVNSIDQINNYYDGTYAGHSAHERPPITNTLKRGTPPLPRRSTSTKMNTQTNLHTPISPSRDTNMDLQRRSTVSSIQSGNRPMPDPPIRKDNIQENNIESKQVNQEVNSQMSVSNIGIGDITSELQHIKLKSVGNSYEREIHGEAATEVVHNKPLKKKPPTVPKKKDSLKGKAPPPVPKKKPTLTSFVHS